ncbi:MAG TPA: translation elongation factor Ts [Acholeplasmataceae bacterium]|nr:translation elongation factor Ts [Acholeplasmataceae bacterium]
MNLTHIKTLREETGLGILEVKEALNQAQDDLDRARDILMSKTTKKETNQRVASRGLTSVEVSQNEAILFEVNAETDFVAKHPDFMKLMSELGKVFIHSKAITVKDALKLTLDNHTVEDEINRISNLVKEHVYLRRFHRIKKQENQHFETYKHQGGKLSVLLIYKESGSAARDLALQITSHAPKYLSFASLDQESYNFEEMMLKKDHPNFSTDEIKENIKNMCLLDQPFIKNPDQKVSEILNGLIIIDFYRFELGQGIENKLNCRLDIPCDGSKITVTPIF